MAKEKEPVVEEKVEVAEKPVVKKAKPEGRASRR